MKRLLLAAAASAAFAVPALAHAQLEQLRGKMKPGLYEYKMDMEMPGMPQGMGKQSHTMQHCVTEQDMDKGRMGGGDRNHMPENCEVKDFKMSGNTATYRMECKGRGKNGGDMSTDNKITFRDNGYTMDMKMNMAQGPGGQPMTMNQHMEGKYLGACSK